MTLFIGLVGWRIQLIGKRRTELAEEALLAVAQAVDAVKAIRSPATWSHEQEAVRKEAGNAVDQKVPGEVYRVTLWRIGENREKFNALRKLQLLCRYHFGDDAARPFDKLHAQVHHVALAANMAAATARDEPENLVSLRREMKWEAAIWEGYGQPDDVADKVDAAQRDLEAILAPHLRADAALLPIAGGWRRVAARLAFWRKSARS
ncbi:hypothetical protein ACFOEH_15135 [Roseomonas sp. CGMCC 1.13459]|uniref:Uncharacterized protein n=1 Tax=Falsiroseomonas oleicola TaxID=2801474 RepID=A0ABS6H8L6_9PROT|nr:hypothetical protein [Roseomonas oleicola]